MNVTLLVAMSCVFASVSMVILGGALVFLARFGGQGVMNLINRIFGNEPDPKESGELSPANERRMPPERQRPASETLRERAQQLDFDQALQQPSGQTAAFAAQSTLGSGEFAQPARPSLRNRQTGGIQQGGNYYGSLQDGAGGFASQQAAAPHIPNSEISGEPPYFQSPRFQNPQLTPSDPLLPPQNPPGTGRQQFGSDTGGFTPLQGGTQEFRPSTPSLSPSRPFQQGSNPRPQGGPGQPGQFGNPPNQQPLQGGLGQPGQFGNPPNQQGQFGNPPPPPQPLQGGLNSQQPGQFGNPPNQQPPSMPNQLGDYRPSLRPSPGTDSSSAGLPPGRDRRRQDDYDRIYDDRGRDDGGGIGGAIGDFMDNF